ncbi:MAG: GNAT family N-acetyltransferase [Candidatus Hodarchaeales archaeon]
MDELKLAEYTSGDETQIIELFKNSFQVATSIDYWNWRFRDNPTGKIAIKLMWDKDFLAGHYAVSPIHLNYFGMKIDTALSNMTMTHSKYWGKGIFPKLADALYSDLAVNTEFIWGYPNENSHYSFVKKLKWVDIYQIPMFSFTHGSIPRKLKVTNNKGHIEKINTFDTRFDTFWNDFILSKKNISVYRSSDYLNWRFIQNPVNRYHVRAYLEEETLKGYLIHKFYKNDKGEIEVDIVDFQVQSPEVFGILLNSLFDEIEENPPNRINTWLNPSEEIFLTLEKIGFRSTAPITFLGAFNLKKESQTFENILKFSNWSIRMSDSDVF